MILRMCVVIPCFESASTVELVAKGVLERTPLNVRLLIGSTGPSTESLLRLPAIRHAVDQNRLRLQRFDSAAGKGRALRSTIDQLVAEGFTHMLTLDADGRYFASEIEKFVAAANAHPWDLILGNRGLKPAEGGGWFKRASRKLLSYAVRFETGTQIQDARSTYRVYPLFALQMMPFWFSGDGFELEVLIRSVWRGYVVREIPIETATVAESAEPIAKVRGALKMSLLNVVLVCLSLLKTHNAPFELALAIGLGIFVGCTPAFGFHTLMVVALAVGLRLNFVALWLGTHVSTPILIPAVLYAEFWIGEHWLGIAGGKGMIGHIWQWTAGSIVLGILLGVPGALLAFFLSRSMQRKASTLDDSGPSLRYRILAFVTRRFGLPAAYGWLRFSALSRYFHRLNARRGLDQFHRVLDPSLGFWRRQGRVIRHLRIIGELHADQIARGGKLPAGVALKGAYLSAHFGGLGAGSGRSANGAGEFIDDPNQPDLELISFFGKLGIFSVGSIPKIGSDEYSAVLLPRAPGGSYQLRTVSLPRVTNPASAESRLQSARIVVAELEKEVRQNPEQWLNAFPFFSTRPNLS